MTVVVSTGGTIAMRPDPAGRPLPYPSGPMPTVDLIRLYAGSDARFLRASVARAIVLEATGRGNGNEHVVDGVRDAVAAGVPVVVTSRCVAGRVEPLYGVEARTSSRPARSSRAIRPARKHACSYSWRSRRVDVAEAVAAEAG